MDYEGVEALVEKYRPILDKIDELGLMWHFNIRRLRIVKESANQRTYHTHLADMQAPLCLAIIIEALERDGYTVSSVSNKERGKDAILKGKIKDKEEYCILIHESRVNDIVMYVGEEEIMIDKISEYEEARRDKISNYEPELFAKERGMSDVLSGFLGFLRRR